MNKPKLSILIPTTPDREPELCKLEALLHKLSPPKTGRFSAEKKYPYYYGWYNDEIEVIICLDHKEMSIGEKRELLYKAANGTYAWQIDSDDLIADNAIDLILEAIKSEPDCVTFEERCEINGELYNSNHSIRYDDWAEKQGVWDYVRTPFMKSVIKTEIAQSVPVPRLRFGEDHAWAMLLKHHLKNEVHIDEPLYYYIHNSKPEDFNERYGINRNS